MDKKNKISLDAEVRCGYEVTEKSKKIWNIELDLVMELLRVCEKYHIKVFAFAGTLLGTVRHKGFIPWDDDMDMALLREDYEKLLSVSEKEFKSPYFLQHALSDRRYFLDYARLRNSSTTGLITWNQSCDYNNGIFIDVFVLDGYTESRAKLEFQLFKRSVLRNIFYSYNLKNIYTDAKGIKKCLLLLLHLFAKTKSFESWYEIYCNVLSKYTAGSTRVSLMTHDHNFIRKYWCNKDELQKIIWLDFENIKLPAPAVYDSLLTHCYGDYMKYPPAELRGAWHENMIIYDPDRPYSLYLEVQSNKNDK